MYNEAIIKNSKLFLNGYNACSTLQKFHTNFYGYELVMLITL